MSLYDEMKTIIPDITHSQYSIQALDALFDRPIFKSADFVRRSGISRPSAMRLLDVLKDNKILSTIRESRGRQGALMMFDRLISIVKD